MYCYTPKEFKMNKLFLILFFALLVGCSSTGVKEKNATSQKISKEKWIFAMKTTMPVAICTSDQYFRQCFDVTEFECEEIATSSVRICVNELNDQIPTVLKSSDKQFWGGKIGRCIGNSLEAVNYEKKTSNSKCNDASNWL